mgnify:CR=1 FL=1
MSKCKTCSADITWAWSENTEKWVPVETDTVTGDEDTHLDDYGKEKPVLERHMTIHTHKRGGGQRPSGGTHARDAAPAPSGSVDAAYAALHLRPSAPSDLVRIVYAAMRLAANTPLQRDQLDARFAVISKEWRK